MTKDHPLNNPVWHSLNECHQVFGIDYAGMKFYHPNYCAFGGFYPESDDTTALKEYAQLTSSFFVVGQKPILPKGFDLETELVCLQMWAKTKIKPPQKDEITILGEEHVQDLLGLVKVAFPEYFKQKTASLGQYYGIYKDKKLVAITGERMRMNDYVELSGVVTHPQYTRKGYAQQLVIQTMNTILEQGKTPYLHVSATNTKAIELYKKVGFQTRRKISFWKIKPVKIEI